MVNQQLKNQIQPYFESLWRTTMEYGWVDVAYEGQVVKETGETWKDRKFEMFLEEVEPCQQQLINLSLKYKELSSQIQPLVELIEEMERKTIV